MVLFSVNPGNVSLQFTRLRKIVGTPETVKMLIYCVTLIVTPNNNRSRERLFSVHTVDRGKVNNIGMPKLLGFAVVSTGRSVL